MKKIKLKHMDLIPILIIAFLLFKLVFSAEMSLGSAFKTIYSCISYFLYGLVLAYLLNPFVSFLEKKVVKEDEPIRKRRRKRSIIIGVVYLLVLGMITVFIVSIVPAIINGISEFVEKFPEHLASAQNWMSATFSFINPNVTKNINLIISQLAENFTSWATNNVDVGQISGAVTTAVSGSARFIINLTFAVVVSVYFMHGKERLLKQLRRFIYAVFSEEKADDLLICGKKINKIFYDFILSKLVQAFVLFVVGLIVLVPLRIHFAPLISFTLAASNMIPYIGPWLGSVPCVLLLLLYDPIQAFILLAFILAMQLIDNVFIGPKITSDRVGVSPLLVIAGVAIGGTFGGIIGMFIGVPIVAVIKLIFYDGFVERRLKEKNLEI